MENFITDVLKKEGTMLYHKTRLHHVMQALGSKIVRTEKEICKLNDAGFEYVTEFEGAKISEKGTFNMQTTRKTEETSPSGIPHIYV